MHGYEICRMDFAHAILELIGDFFKFAIITFPVSYNFYGIIFTQLLFKQV